MDAMGWIMKVSTTCVKVSVSWLIDLLLLAAASLHPLAVK